MEYTYQASVFSSTRGILFIGLFFCIGVSSETFFCEPGQQVKIERDDVTNNGTIRTVEDGKDTYGSNFQCTWILDAGHDTNVHWRVQLTVEYSDLEWAPESAICQSYDYIQVRDGQHAHSSTIVTWCGTQNPQSITSSGRFLRVTFTSNDRMTYKGASLQFSFFALSQRLESCPPGWFDNPRLPGGGGYCYAVRLFEETWTRSQEHCNYDQGNLVSIPDEQILILLTEEVQELDLSSADFWIGLNDIEYEGKYTWLEPDVPTSFFKWRYEPHNSDPYHNCVIMRGTDGAWREDFCNVNDIKTLVKHRFICKINKEGNTTIYPVPPARRESEGETHHNLTALWVMCALVPVAIAIGIIVRFVLKNRRKSLYDEAPTDGPPHVDNEISTVGETQPREPSAPPLYHDVSGDSPWVPNVPPPSYDTVASDKVIGV